MVHAYKHAAIPSNERSQLDEQRDNDKEDNDDSACFSDEDKLTAATARFSPPREILRSSKVFTWSLCCCLGTALVLLFLFFTILSKNTEATTTNQVACPLNDNVTDAMYISCVMEQVIVWQLAHPKHALYQWQNAVLYAGILAAFQQAPTDRQQTLCRQALMDMGHQNDWQVGPRLQKADDYAIGQTYIDLYRILLEEEQQKENSPLSEPTQNEQLAHTMLAPLVAQLTLAEKEPYVPSSSSERDKYRQILWWWADALFMGPPTVVKLATTTTTDITTPEQRQAWLAWSDQKFHETYDLLYDTTQHLWARDARYLWNNNTATTTTTRLTEPNGEQIFWSRGNGWVAAGLARMLNDLPANYEQRPFYVHLFQEFMHRVLELQPLNGLWRPSLLDPQHENVVGETSGSALFCYAMAWGVRHQVLNATQFRPAIAKTWQALLSQSLQPNYSIGWVQQVGYEPQSNFNATSWETYGTGAFLLAASEMMQLYS